MRKRITQEIQFQNETEKKVFEYLTESWKFQLSMNINKELEELAEKTLSPKVLERFNNFKLFYTPSIPFGQVFVRKNHPNNYYALLQFRKDEICIINLTYNKRWSNTIKINGNSGIDWDKKLISEHTFQQMFNDNSDYTLDYILIDSPQNLVNNGQ